jgi:hypothetical protein
VVGALVRGWPIPVSESTQRMINALMTRWVKRATTCQWKGGQRGTWQEDPDVVERWLKC